MSQKYVNGKISHRIPLVCEVAFTEHKYNASVGVQRKKNVCTFIEKDGKNCLKKFKYMALLIVHSLVQHSCYICEGCNVILATIKELKEHKHGDRETVQSSEYEENLHLKTQ